MLTLTDDVDEAVAMMVEASRAHREPDTGWRRMMWFFAVLVVLAIGGGRGGRRRPRRRRWSEAYDDRPDVARARPTAR